MENDLMTSETKAKKPPNHKAGECDIVDKVCLTCGFDFKANPPGLVQLRIIKKTPVEPWATIHAN